MLTKDSEDLSRPGFFLKLSSGTVLESSEKPASRGTTVWVRELFYNLPVRKKFLRKDLTELSYINEFVDKFILAHPAVAFELIVNGTTVLKTSGRGDLLENLVALYGSEIAEDLKKIQGGGGVKISGVATFRKSWLNRRRQFLLVNGRPIKSGFLNRAIDEAYRGILPKGRFPLIVAFLEIPPDEVDVNIHPQKSEVKFLKPAQVLEAFSAALAGALKTLPGSVTAASQEGEGSGLAEASIYQAESFWEKLADFSLTEDENYKAFQFAETYLVLIHDGKIALVDQHAASERINYEKLLASVGAGPAEAQQKLLTPVTLEISHSEANFLRENLAVLAELGFEIEPFGGGTFLLRAVPVFLFDRKPVEVLEKVCQEIKEVSLSSGLQKSREEIAALVACHSAVRAGDILNPVQIQELLGEFFKTANYQTCPHGRPTLIYLTKEELEKKFFRK
jgi:DNA mismatch repair protein MutL